MKIDLERCRRGMRQLVISGTPRAELIEFALAAIQHDPGGALRNGYFGIKNYASFGDQREDHAYGEGPKHGVIVFSIGRTPALRDSVKELDADAIYYLEAYRDFGHTSWPNDSPGAPSYQKTIALTLGHAIRLFDEFGQKRDMLAAAFEKAEVESHVAA